MQQLHSGIMTQWVGTTKTQPQSGQPHKMTEWGQQIEEPYKRT